MMMMKYLTFVLYSWNSNVWNQQFKLKIDLELEPETQSNVWYDLRYGKNLCFMKLVSLV